ncbi:unnamed protein product, partial [Scytosiphon promiscuus]
LQETCRAQVGRDGLCGVDRKPPTWFRLARQRGRKSPSGTLTASDDSKHLLSTRILLAIVADVVPLFLQYSDRLIAEIARRTACIRSLNGIAETRSAWRAIV